MIGPLLALPAHLRERLARALESGYVCAPYTKASLRSALGSDVGVEAVRGALGRLAARGISGPAVALALDAVASVAAQIDRPDLVWSGPAVAGLQARDTRRVYEELVAGAEHSIWVSTFAYYDGPQAFRTLAQRMDEAPAVQVTLLLNIQRRPGDTTAADALASVLPTASGTRIGRACAGPACSTTHAHWDRRASTACSTPRLWSSTTGPRS